MRRTRDISGGTIARFVLLLAGLINAGLNMAGYQTLPVNDEAVETFINMAWLGGASLWAYWKDNDVTKEARTYKDGQL